MITVCLCGTAGHGLFIGNSMPIRDMDMYASWHSSSSLQSSPSPSQGQVPAGGGCPVGSNRGASGIDGVLSTAAGFAAGLKRPVTLVVGDVSFLHDINGLNLLRTGDFQAVVLKGVDQHYVANQADQQQHPVNSHRNALASLPCTCASFVNGAHPCHCSALRQNTGSTSFLKEVCTVFSLCNANF